MSSWWIQDDSSRNIGCSQNITVLIYISVVSIDQFVETNLLFVSRSPKFASKHPPCDTGSSRTDADLVLMPVLMVNQWSHENIPMITNEIVSWKSR